VSRTSRPMLIAAVMLTPTLAQGGLTSTPPPELYWMPASYCAGDGQQQCLQIWDQLRQQLIAQRKATCGTQEACRRQLVVDVAMSEAEATWSTVPLIQGMLVRGTKGSGYYQGGKELVQGWARLQQYYGAADYTGDTSAWSRRGVYGPSWCGIFDIWAMREVFGDAVPRWGQGGGISKRATNGWTTHEWDTGVTPHPADYVSLGRDFARVKPGDICTYTCQPEHRAHCNEQDPITKAFKYHVDHHAMVSAVNPDGSFDVINGNGQGGAVALARVASPSALYEGCYAFTGWTR
jgi:hypothetical protein